ncbi:unnamed protein product [Prorocentrum cordatum]|uniref:Protein kinase domain-containing protein n=1 Tax=Prorocentrum cordatum TaxID=2364126 RepID=A0ABN9SWM9_9DINO|nr:unnamed protein product [Polarella glacialis]
MGCSGGKAVASPPSARTGGQSPKSRSSSSSTKDPFDAAFILDDTRRIQNFYADEDDGACAMGDMRRVRHKKTQEVRALKTRAKVHVESPELIKQEIDIRRELDHPNIAKLHETFEDHRNIYLVTELCEEGELFDRVIEAGRITEMQAAAVMQQVLSAALHMHERRVCHRNLTIDSFFFASPGPISTKKKRHKHKLSEIRADFLDRRMNPPGDAAPGALCAPGRGFQRRSKKSARSSASVCECVFMPLFAPLPSRKAC